MGLTYSKMKYVNDIIDKHQKLHKAIKNNNLKSNFVVFSLPISFDYPRQSKSYLEQIISAIDKELTCTKYNELYITSLEMKICSNGSVITNNLDFFIHGDGKNAGIRILETNYNNT
jgi:hypothetical protein